VPTIAKAEPRSQDDQGHQLEKRRICAKPQNYRLILLFKESKREKGVRKAQGM